MTSVEMAISPAPVAGTTPVAVTANIPAAMDTAHGDASFAALIAGLLMTGEGSSGVQHPLAAIFARSFAESADMGVLEEEAGRTASWETVLEQLLVWFQSLPAEVQEQFANHAEVAQWMALANAELVMSGAVEQSADGPNELASTLSAGIGPDTDAKANGVAALLERLLHALNAQPGQPHLQRTVEQAVPVLAKALSEFAATPGFGKELLQESAPLALNSLSQTAAHAKSGDSALGLLLSRMNGQVVTTEKTSEAVGGKNAVATHLQAMQAKTALVRITSESAATSHLTLPQDVTGKAVDLGVLSVSGLSDSVSSGVSAPIKIASAEPLPGTSTVPQRVPVTNVFEHLNDWMLKQTAAGGNVKTETVIRLVPEHLGSLEVKLSLHNGQLSASIVTESAAARDVLESNLAALRLSLQNQGVAVDRLIVTQQPSGGQTMGFFQDGRGGRQFSSGKESDRGKRFAESETADDWADALALSAEQAAIGMDMYGRSSTFRAEA